MPYTIGEKSCINSTSEGGGDSIGLDSTIR